jgi:cobalt-zinc-cadmium efflux system protein
MIHTHGHSHSQGASSWGRAFAIGIALNVAFVVVEIIYGLAANSSALLADAGHNASDVLSLAFAWTAIWIASRKPSGKYTYGLRRTTILASMLNGTLLLVAVSFIAWDAVRKFSNPVEVAGSTIMIVAGIGVVINTITALLFMRGQRDDLNIKAAFLHMAADAAVSLGVVVAGFAIRYTGAFWIDPVMSFVIVGVIIYGTWGLLVDSTNLALDAAPKEIHVAEVRRYLQSLPGVENVHDLHVWGLSTTEAALTAHVVAPAGKSDEFLYNLRQKLREQFGIAHSTIQIERSLEEYRRCDTCD